MLYEIGCEWHFYQDSEVFVWHYDQNVDYIQL